MLCGIGIAREQPVSTGVPARPHGGHRAQGRPARPAAEVYSNPVALRRPCVLDKMHHISYSFGLGIPAHFCHQQIRSTIDIIGKAGAVQVGQWSKSHWS